jgi:hypothetical protein
MEEQKFKFKAKIQSPDGKQVINFYYIDVTFHHDPTTYGNGYYMKIDGADLGFNNIFDCRYDRRLDRNDLPAYVRWFIKNLYSGKHGSWKLIEWTECY